MNIKWSLNGPNMDLKGLKKDLNCRKLKQNWTKFEYETKKWIENGQIFD